MNNSQRQRILDAKHHAQIALALTATVIEEAREALDNIPDNLRDSQRNVQAEEALLSLDAFLSTLETAIEELDDIITIGP